jgi:hypothetical protein
MTNTLESILQSAGSYTDQEATTPTGTDLSTRTAYANRALNEWADFDDWDELLSTYAFTVTGTGGVATTLTLPTTFRKPMSPLAIYASSTPTMYEIIPADERFTIDPTKNYCYLTGDGSQGYTLNIPNGLSSGVSAIMDIQSFPTALASLTDQVPMKSADYVIQRIISLVLESRGDSRFPTAKAEADSKLASMGEAQNAKNIGMHNQIPMDKTFVIGE